MSTILTRLEDALHFALKKEQRVWGSGGEHEQARNEVERLEKLIEIEKERKERTGKE